MLNWQYYDFFWKHANNWKVHGKMKIIDISNILVMWHGYQKLV